MAVAVSAIANSQNLIGDLAEEILGNNTELTATHQRNEAERAALKSNNNLSDPEIELGHQWGQGGIGTKWNVGISQSFEWPGVYSARREANEATSRSFDLLNQSKAVEIKQTAMDLLVDIYYGQKKIELLKGILGRIDSLTSVCRKGVATGDISRLDLNKLKIERITAAGRLSEATSSYSASVSELTGLNGGKSTDGIIERLSAYTPSTLHPIDKYLHSAQTNAPAIQYASALEKVEAANEKVLKRSRIPGFSFGVSHEYEMGEHFNGITLGLTLPIFSNRHKQAEIESRRIAIQSERYNAENSTTSEIRTAYGQIQDLDRLIGQYREVLSDSENLRLLDVALKAQHITMLDYLMEYNYFTDAETQLIETCRQRDRLMNVLQRW